MAVYTSQWAVFAGNAIADSIRSASGGSAVSADMNIIDLEINFLCFNFRVSIFLWSIMPTKKIFDSILCSQV